MSVTHKSLDRNEIKPIKFPNYYANSLFCGKVGVSLCHDPVVFYHLEPLFTILLQIILNGRSTLANRQSHTH